MQGGWIKLHRKLVNWEWYTDIPTKTLFIHLLLIANHEPKKWQGKVIDRGEKVTSISKLAVETGLTAKQVRTALSKLIDSNVVGKQVTNKYTLIKVLNYADYQDTQDEKFQEEGKQRANDWAIKGQTKGKQRATNKNIKNDKNDKKKEYIGFCKPTLEEIQSYISEKGFTNVDAESFFNFYESKGWLVGKSKMKSWKAALSGWNARNKKPTDKSRISTQPSYDINSIQQRAMFNDNFDI